MKGWIASYMGSYIGMPGRRFGVDQEGGSESQKRELIPAMRESFTKIGSVQGGGLDAPSDSFDLHYLPTVPR